MHNGNDVIAKTEERIEVATEMLNLFEHFFPRLMMLLREMSACQGNDLVALQAFEQTLGGMTTQEAKEMFASNGVTLDQIADIVLQRVGTFFGECVQDAKFCAVGVDVKRDSAGRLLAMRLVPCDADEHDSSTHVRRWTKEWEGDVKITLAR